jgi:DNA mismatch repair protein MutS2
MFPPGSDVIVIGINRRGRVIDARGDVYRILIGGLTITCRAHELRAPDATGAARGKTRKAGRGRDSVEAGGSATHEPAVVRSIDLHGMAVEEARTAVADFLSRAVMEGADTLEIVHGIGTGRVRDAIRRELESIGAVRRVRPHPTNPGITIVHL